MAHWLIADAQRFNASKSSMSAECHASLTVADQELWLQELTREIVTGRYLIHHSSPSAEFPLPGPFGPPTPPPPPPTTTTKKTKMYEGDESRRSRRRTFHSHPSPVAIEVNLRRSSLLPAPNNVAHFPHGALVRRFYSAPWCWPIVVHSTAISSESGLSLSVNAQN